jgi:hypothetical protein
MLSPLFCRRPTATRSLRHIAASPYWSRFQTNGAQQVAQHPAPQNPPHPRRWQLVGWTLVSLAGGYAIGSARSGNTHSQIVEDQAIHPQEEAKLDSGKRLVDFKQADTAIRSRSLICGLGGENSSKGSTSDVYIHAANLPSNNPCEDDMVISAASGVGGTQVICNGVFDGHA